MQTVKVMRTYITLHIDTKTYENTHTHTNTLYAGEVSPQTKSTNHSFFFPKDSLPFLLSQDFNFSFARGLRSQTGIDPELPYWNLCPKGSSVQTRGTPLHLLQSWFHSMLHYAHINHDDTQQMYAPCAKHPLPGLFQ